MAVVGCCPCVHGVLMQLATGVRLRRGVGRWPRNCNSRFFSGPKRFVYCGAKEAGQHRLVGLAQTWKAAWLWAAAEERPLERPLGAVKLERPLGAVKLERLERLERPLGAVRLESGLDPSSNPLIQLSGPTERAPGESFRTPGRRR